MKTTNQHLFIVMALASLALPASPAAAFDWFGFSNPVQEPDPEPPKPKPQPTTTKGGKPLRAETCPRLYNAVVPAYKALAKKLREPLLKLQPTVTTHVAEMPDVEQSCAEESAKGSQEMIVQAVSKHSGMIGLILPMHGPMSSASQAIINGVKAYLTHAGIPLENLVMVKNSNGNAVDAETALTDLVFRQNVGLVIGGVSRAEAAALGPWADKLMLPMLMLSPPQPTQKTGRNVFHVFPNEIQMAENMTQAIVAQKVKRLGILQPTRQKPSKFMEHLLVKLKSVGVSTELSATYNSNDYEAMEAAARKIFKIDMNERREEYEELYKTAKEEAQKSKVPFDSRLVSLPPLVEVDAILIPDNFRTVRYFVKIFKFLNVKRMPLIGTQEWRAAGLVNPPEPYLDGAIFGDYVGSYTKLPEGINVVTQGSPYFIAAQDSNTVDFQIIGHHAMRLAYEALRSGNETRKRSLNKTLAGLEIKQSPFFRPGRAFSPNRTANWPFFLFRVRKDAIELTQ